MEDHSGAIQSFGLVQQAVRDALIGFMAATAEAQAEATRIAQRGGIDLAKAD